MHEPWKLFLFLVPMLLWVIVSLRRDSWRGSLLLAGLSFVALGLLVSKPESARRELKESSPFAAERFAMDHADISERLIQSKQIDKRHTTHPGSCLVLVLEKSSSMGGKKMELERLAALEIAENLRRTDMIGVLTFDDSFQWPVPIRPARLEDPIDREIEGITASGGTRIAPALAEAVRSIVPINSATKHILLFTDGRSEDIDSLALAHEAAAWHVTISTVGLGERENRRYLETVAQWAGGESYIISDPLEVEQTIVRDAIANSRSTELGKNPWSAPKRDTGSR